MNAIEELLRGHIRSVREAGEEYDRRVDALEALVDKLGNAPSNPLPAKRINRVDGWSNDEDETLDLYYPSIGAEGCSELLPHRTVLAIRTHAHKRGLTFPQSAKRYFCEQCDGKVTSGQIAACQSKFCKGKALVAASGDAPTLSQENK